MIRAAILVIGVYFMLAPEDANNRFKISLRNQTKYLVGMFLFHALMNMMIVATIGISAGALSALFLGIDLFIAKRYYDML